MTHDTLRVRPRRSSSGFFAATGRATTRLVLCVILSLAWNLDTAASAVAQPAGRFILGRGGHTWASGGDGIDPTVIVGATSRGVEDTTNAPGDAIRLSDAATWLGPLSFAEDENIASRVLSGGRIRVRNAFYGVSVAAQLQGTVNGDHDVAFERKPTPFSADISIRDVWVILDFGRPVGIHRIRFYPRNTVVPTPGHPFQSDYLRGYEVWTNPGQTTTASPDLLAARAFAVTTPVADISVPPQYARLVMVRSLVNTPYEIDEVEVYGTGFLQEATYLSDILDLGDRATLGPLHWQERTIGDPAFSDLSLRIRTGNDDTPVRYLQWVPDQRGRRHPVEAPGPDAYYALDPRDRAGLEDDLTAWSGWSTVTNGGLVSAPVPRRYVQFRLDFTGDLRAARQVRQVRFDYLQPPLADTLRAEVFPRTAVAEAPASFRYAVKLRRTGSARGYDHLEIDTNVRATRVRAVLLDGTPVPFTLSFLEADGFGLDLPLISADGSVLEFSFDLPIFRFGTTFSGRVYRRDFPGIPQRLQAGDAQDFGPGDVPELSGLFVSIPREQIGRLVGDVVVSGDAFTPNGDGVNDAMEVRFNLLQLVAPAPVSLRIYDLAGTRVTQVMEAERGIGPVAWSWDGRRDDGRLVAPGVYVWVLRVNADAVDERHAGVVAVAY